MTAADLDRVLEIAQSLKQAPHWPRTAYLAALAREAAPRRIAFVAEDPGTGRLEGFVVARLTPPEAELETIVVAAGSQRRGLAQLIFSALAETLRQAKVNEIFLDVRPSNLVAQALYRRLGFAQTGRRLRYYADPVEDAVLMRLSLL
jgi:ribosomal-protein-alanine N-acetyltransferase